MGPCWAFHDDFFRGHGVVKASETNTSDSIQVIQRQVKACAKPSQVKDHHALCPNVCRCSEKYHQALCPKVCRCSQVKYLTEYLSHDRYSNYADNLYLIKYTEKLCLVIAVCLKTMPVYLGCHSISGICIHVKYSYTHHTQQNA